MWINTNLVSRAWEHNQIPSLEVETRGMQQSTTHVSRTSNGKRKQSQGHANQTNIFINFASSHEEGISWRKYSTTHLSRLSENKINKYYFHMHPKHANPNLANIIHVNMQENTINQINLISHLECTRWRLWARAISRVDNPNSNYRYLQGILMVSRFWYRFYRYRPHKLTRYPSCNLFFRFAFALTLLIMPRCYGFTRTFYIDITSMLQMVSPVSWFEIFVIRGWWWKTTIAQG